MSLTNVDGGIEVNRVVRTECMPCVGPALVRNDAGNPVHGPQVEAILSDLEAVGVQLAAGLEDL